MDYGGVSHSLRQRPASKAITALLLRNDVSKWCARGGTWLPRRMTSEGVQTRVSRMILIVDDDSDVRETSADMLTELGYTVQQAESGSQALEMLGKTSFDIMVTDIRMPGMSGLELSSLAAKQHQALKIILVSGYFQPQPLSYRFLQKPFRTDDLDTAIRAELGSQPSPVP